jgi:hypothetical protein
VVTYLEKRRVVLQMAEKVRAQAHHRAQAWVGHCIGKQFRKAHARLFFGAHVKFLALIDV